MPIVPVYYYFIIIIIIIIIVVVVVVVFITPGPTWLNMIHVDRLSDSKTVESANLQTKLYVQSLTNIDQLLQGQLFLDMGICYMR